jgi:hypothetical protein
MAVQAAVMQGAGAGRLGRVKLYLDRKRNPETRSLSTRTGEVVNNLSNEARRKHPERFGLGYLLGHVSSLFA